MGGSAAPPEKRSKGMKLAEEQLKRHGWRKGKGLGKQENGISEAIKVKVKCDTAGVGHSSAEQFTYHWWDHLFNSSAANIAVVTGQDGVKMKRVSEQNGVITNKKPRKANGDKNLLYGCFRKVTTLLPGGEQPVGSVASSGSSEDDEDEALDLSTARRLTDEELVKACGGRTAHKGARHGLTMAAKLARLEEQEKAFVASCVRQKKAEPPGAAVSSSSPHRKEKKAKKRRRTREEVAAMDRSPEAVGAEQLHVPQGESERLRKKKKKKRRKREEAAGSEG